MAELLITHVTKNELDNGVLPMNHVLCHQFYESEGAKTRSGIIYGINTELTYASATDDKDSTSHIADMAETALRVYKTPERLFFDPEDKNSMEWETEMDLVEDDIVFTNPIEALNSVTLECEGELYHIIPYADLYCAKRTIWVNKWEGTKKDIVVCLNGYVLLSEVYFDKTSELDVTSTEKVDPTKGVIRYVGSCNKRYKHPDYVDFEDLREGDLVLFGKKTVTFKLERQLYASKFSDKELFLVCQRRGINMILERK